MGPTELVGVLGILMPLAIVATFVAMRHNLLTRRAQNAAIQAETERIINRAIRCTFESTDSFERAMAIDIDPPEHQIQAWTPQEREVFGINDTISLIDRIDREFLKMDESAMQASERRVREALEAQSPAAARVLAKHETLYGPMPPSEAEIEARGRERLTRLDQATALARVGLPANAIREILVGEGPETESIMAWGRVEALQRISE